MFYYTRDVDPLVISVSLPNINILLKTSSLSIHSLSI